MDILRITDLFNGEVYIWCSCGVVYQGDTCPHCEYVDQDTELTKELLSQDAYYGGE